MKKTYVITGANGFLGNNIIRILEKQINEGDEIRALVLPEDKLKSLDGLNCKIYKGDVTDIDSLKDIFSNIEADKVYVIHCAAIVYIKSKYNQKVYDVNVGGTKNMIDKCLEHSECRKMVYVSSTGAIPEQPRGTVIREVEQFTPIDERRQVGCYSQSKAMATQAVLDACRDRGLKACVVHPSGILGPKDYAVGETTGTVIKIMNGKMPLGMAYKLAEQMEKKAEKTGEKPLMTSFAVYNLARNNRFDYSKAERELGYHTRPYEETLRDEAKWLMKEGYIEGKKQNEAGSQPFKMAG